MAMKHLLAHELMHTWIGQKIRNAGSDERPEAWLYWFSEGFTDYYARKLLFDAELITQEERLAHYNRMLYDYYVKA